MDSSGNIFADLTAPTASGDEQFEVLLTQPGVRIERIISNGHASPRDFWYEQDWDEWVIVLSGEARLRFEEEADARALAAGDYVFIPAKVRHRVDWTRRDQATMWLAVHFGREGNPG
jgi:cupin 2 domain-containing protein